ncbi:MAG: hypothetical protein IKU94_07940 [Bacteroidaceae bacterium]|nr:hypothetical protein [Bacteroidaceae bacterium]
MALPLGYIPVFHNIGGGTVAVTLHHARALMSWPASPRRILTFGLGYSSLRRYHGTFQPCARTGRIRFFSKAGASQLILTRRRCTPPSG